MCVRSTDKVLFYWTQSSIVHRAPSCVSVTRHAHATSVNFVVAAVFLCWHTHTSFERGFAPTDRERCERGGAASSCLQRCCCVTSTTRENLRARTAAALFVFALGHNTSHIISSLCHLESATDSQLTPPFPPTPLLPSNHNHGLQPLIWRDYRGDVEPSAIEKFYPLVMDTEEDVRSALCLSSCPAIFFTSLHHFTSPLDCTHTHTSGHVASAAPLAVQCCWSRLTSCSDA